jgi:hypothetical protein
VISAGLTRTATGPPPVATSQVSRSRETSVQRALGAISRWTGSRRGTSASSVESQPVAVLLAQPVADSANALAVTTTTRRALCYSGVRRIGHARGPTVDLRIRRS